MSKNKKILDQNLGIAIQLYYKIASCYKKVSEKGKS